MWRYNKYDCVVWKIMLALFAVNTYTIAGSFHYSPYEWTKTNVVGTKHWLSRVFVSKNHKQKNCVFVISWLIRYNLQWKHRDDFHFGLIWSFSHVFLFLFLKVSQQPNRNLLIFLLTQKIWRSWSFVCSRRVLIISLNYFY